VKILVVEDDARLREQLSDSLTNAGFLVETAADGEEGEFLGATEAYAAAIVDLGLPRMTGLEILRSWRDAGNTLPVLLLTARGDWTDKIAGFRAGADDYVVKPVRNEEIVLRIQTILRRSSGHASVAISVGGLVLDTHTGLVTLDGSALRLTAFEHRLLTLLMHRRDRVVTRTEMSENLYGSMEERDFRSIEVIIGRLRRKLGADRIETRRGVGYRLVDDPA
jgi:two-component system OmpR family response regulator